ncbi:hypothetical protein EBR25_11895 [bacterium]|nr:hypothetical protein [bacterium]
MRHFMRQFHFSIALVLCTLILGCGGGGDGRSNQESSDSGSASANYDCDGSCSHQSLLASEVEQILLNAIVASESLGVAATVAVVDRVGNVLAVYQMDGAAQTTIINGQKGAIGGLEGVSVPATLAAISKAGTGAYLSSQGNAFSTRTASQIIQENFNPGESSQPGGPLFGVQFSQLICSDITTIPTEFSSGLTLGQNPSFAGGIGPRSLPLGLSADPGGFPIYKLGDPVGGIGVELDGLYSLDPVVFDRDDAIEERIALMALQGGFEAPSQRAAETISVVGKSLRFSDISLSELEQLSPSGIALDMERLVPVPLFSNGTIRAGAQFGDPSSGVMKITRRGVAAAVLTDGTGNFRFPTVGGTPLPSGTELAAHEVDALLDSILLTANRTRGQIRNPKNSSANVSIFVVDSFGEVLGMVRSGDAPVFGIDVALQKGRTAVFFSSDDAGARLDDVRVRNAVGEFNDYVGAVRSFIGEDALTGTHAFSDRAGGNLSRPFYPDGIPSSFHGPFSHPFPGLAQPGVRTWSPFNTGLQLDLIFQRLVQPLGIPVNPPSVLPDSCTDSRVLGSRLRNGIQIFPGSVPLYRNGILVGGIGISGDGIDQDDLIAFYGASRKGLDFAGHQSVGDAELGFNAPRQIRADQIQGPLENTRLRYVNCPESPFIDSSEQQVCGEL